MKKKLAMLLAMSMVLGMSTNAFAATSNKATLPGEDGNKETSISVNGEYLAELKSKEIISVDVEWDAMNFTYAAKQQGTWEPTDHTYRDSSQTAAWVGDTTSDIKVTNHSNVGVTANFSFQADVDTVTGTFAEAASASPAGVYIPDDNEIDKNPNYNAPLSVDLKAGEVNKKDEADNKTVTFTIGGTLADTYTTSTNLGTITVSVEKKETTGSEDNTEKKVTALTTELKYKGYSEEIRYNYCGGASANWSNVKLIATYEDGNTETILASDPAVTITYSGKTLEDVVNANGQEFVSCTLTYKGFSYTISVDVYYSDGSGLPSTGGGYELSFPT